MKLSPMKHEGDAYDGNMMQCFTITFGKSTLVMLGVVDVEDNANYNAR
jgi:hypothetical protein